MSRIFLSAAMLISASFLLVSCGDQGAGNAGNKPANGANNATATAPAANSTAIETDIKKAVTDMAASLTKGDAAAFEKLYTDSYRFVGPNGAVSTGPERVASMKSGDTKYESVAYDEVTVRSNAEGTGAVSISRATVKGKNLGIAVDGQFRVTHVWSKTKDGWRLASGQTTPITAAATDAKPANSNTAAATNANAAAPANK